MQLTAAWMKPLAAAAISSLLFFTAALLVLRRIAGALNEPLETPQLAIAACGFAVAVLAIRLLLAGAPAGLREGATAGLSSSDKNTVGQANRGTRQYGYHSVLVRSLATASPTSAVVVAGLSLSLPESTAVGLAVFWTIIIGAESCFFVRSIFGTRLKSCFSFVQVCRGRLVSPSISDDSADGTVGRAGNGTLFEIAIEPKPADERITQQLVRSQDAAGGETISGILRAEFLRGQRTATVHVAFCPPLAALPALEVAQTDGPSARVKTVQLLPYGARFDIKLARDAEAPASVSLRFSARVCNE